MYLPFIFGLLFGFVYGKNDIHKRVISYDKYLICHRIVDYPFGQPKCYASNELYIACLLYTSPSPRDATLSRMPSSA